MDRTQIDLLGKHPSLVDAKIIETHISWLLLTPDKVYKMKKNVQFSFLDFSTLAKRKHYCERELKLNQRLAPGLYEDVVAVNPVGKGLLVFGKYQLNSVGYAIRMRRVAKEWEMTALLGRNEVTTDHMNQLATKLAIFHQEANIDNLLFNPIKALDEFTDISHYFKELLPFIGTKGVEEIKAGIKVGRSFLRRHNKRFHYRSITGFTVDGHGDLHAGNIFLEDGKPIIFDCIEFNDDFRLIDVLDEVAFLYVDLEALGRKDLAEKFANSYQIHNHSLLTEEDRLLFEYYKCYRANIRLKVTAIKLDNHSNEAHADDLIAQLHQYHKLYCKYAEILRRSDPDYSATANPGQEEDHSPTLSHHNP